MFWLLLSIVTNSILLLILKAFPRFGVVTLQGIVVNYLTAGTLGFLLSDSNITLGEIPQQNWAWVPPIMGLLFISIFLVLAKTAQTISVSVATIANKMSLVIPVIAAIILYKEQLSFIQYFGLVIAIVAVILSSLPKESGGKGILHHLFLPIIIFIGSGVIDALVNHAKKLPIPDEQLPWFIACCFLVAFVCGVVTIIFRRITRAEKFQLKSIPAGLILGIPNYFSIFGITKALGSGLMKSSALYPVNNMGIVALSAIGAMLIFRERFSLVNWIGIVLSMIAIALIAFGN